ncbi:MAG: peptidoglycan DD-metalloendopeptidase family protein [Desulfovibrio sp.]|jgi:septal ring factor EnvC (AmiA/AmiB activator)|nr:peptidoglycan DD-metalloendopeptidase family protein [Desulfovibrio sp.]
MRSNDFFLLLIAAVAAIFALCAAGEGACAAPSARMRGNVRLQPPRTLRQLENDLALEQKKAEERKQSLQRLTNEERRLNADLAAAEKRILELEKGLDAGQGKLLALGTAGDKVGKEYETLLAEQKKTEEALARTLQLLWEISNRRPLAEAAEERAAAERDLAVSRELYEALEKYRRQLDRQETRLAGIAGRGNKLSQEMRQSLNRVNEEKARLLKARLAYDKRLGEIRRVRVDAETELNAAIKLISSLNFEISQRQGGDLTALKGRLQKPVSGKVSIRFAGGGDFASRGLGFAAADKAEVWAVAGGKVVHNDVLRGFGTVLIVQHGEDYYTLYAYLGSCPLKVGQEVRGRQKVGTAGYYPAIKGPGLYFELRFKQKAINPEQWFAAL